MEAVFEKDLYPVTEEVSLLRELVQQLRIQNAYLQEKSTQQIRMLEERIKWFERQLFGKKSERLVDSSSGKAPYLPGFEPKDGLTEEEVEEVTAHKRKKKRKTRNDYADGLVIPEHLPVEQIELDIPEDQKVCSETGVALVRIGQEVTRQLAHRSAEFFVKETIRPKYAHPDLEERGILTADLPDSILPRSRADESLLAEIVTRKYADHLPLHRLSEIFSRDGVQLTRQLLSQWLIKLGVILTPLYDLMVQRIKESGLAYVDETPVRLQVKGKGRLQQAYMWVLVGGTGGDPPYRIFRFCENRNHEHAFTLLEGFAGFLHSDKYGDYETISARPEVLWQPCWAHIRRKFEEASSDDPQLRATILRKIRYIFMLERVAWNRSPEERLRIRREKEAPIIDEIISLIKEKVKTGSVLPKSKLGKATYYFNGLVPHLKNYHEHAEARADNNVAERAIRPLAIGRKNWLFVGSLKGGESSAVLISLVQTCRALGINPREYLEDVMRRFHSHPHARLHELLPDEWLKLRNLQPVATKPLHVR